MVVFGLGHTGLVFARKAAAVGFQVSGTVRSRDKAARLGREGFGTHVLSDGEVDAAEIRAEIAGADAVLAGIAPGPDGDPALLRFREDLAAASRLAWIGYLSTVGVYGDHRGGWVDEATEPRPASLRSRQRLDAERAWLALGAETGVPVHLFRLAGIYGPGRSPLQKVRDGTAQRIVKPGQVFNRIHVEDIATVLLASLRKPRAGAVYAVADDEPAPPQDVVVFAAGLLGGPPPPEVPFGDATLSPMARSFYGENKRVSNRLLRDELGVTLRYPTYREGLRALADAGV